MRKTGLFGDFARVDAALVSAAINAAINVASSSKSPGQITKSRAFRPLFW
jgi:hypothetical protein